MSLETTITQAGCKMYTHYERPAESKSEAEKGEAYNQQWVILDDNDNMYTIKKYQRLTVIFSNIDVTI